jgi:hypothetical protein
MHELTLITGLFSCGGGRWVEKEVSSDFFQILFLCSAVRWIEYWNFCFPNDMFCSGDGKMSCTFGLSVAEMLLVAEC